MTIRDRLRGRELRLEPAALMIIPAEGLVVRVGGDAG
jgi:hypothetical protein